MRLHLDKLAFEKIIDDVALANGVRRDVLEKDYYVTLLLLELSKMDRQCYAYFKGGTALYKALRSIQRFSEDIDLTVYVEDCPTPSQAKKRLENATLKYKSLEKGKTLENIRGSITCEYYYESMYELDMDDALQRFGKVKIEGTSFTVSEPIREVEIAPYLYELCDDERKRILREYYEVEPFVIATISLERIFIDKVFAAEFYFERNALADVAKHIYDIAVLLNNDRIRLFLEDKSAVERIVKYKRKEELARKGGVDSERKIVDFRYFKELQGLLAFEKAFNEMQKIYVFDKKDIFSLDEIYQSLSELQQCLEKVNSYTPRQ